ncbi:hypothetical protein U9M48_025215 [Paspalum notatum var. saurae]|uniref:F-box domain-containing protein n=1 Tax=Paspalum notatum var. saurae TaxID=547442 RepID=A0AAQ3WY32_PASNO
MAVDMLAQLPDDVLAVVLGLTALRDLAVSRSVCKAWRAVVDDNRSLHSELLPLSLAGLLITYQGRDITEFFARPSTTTTGGSGKRDFLVDGSEIGSWSEVQNHCNGLLLTERYDDHAYVINPATGWRAPVPLLPKQKQQQRHYRDEWYLAYDPSVSQHYQILSIPCFFGYERCRRCCPDVDPVAEKS